MSPFPSLPENFLDLLLDVLCVVDAEGHFLFVSSACERVLGYRSEELLGRRMLELVHPEDIDRTRQVVRSLMAGEHLHNFENRYLRKDGAVVHLLWSARWSEADQVRVAVAHDITRRKRDEALRAALYAISEAAHHPGDLQALFARVHAIVGDLMPTRNCFIALYDEDSGQLSYPYHVDERQFPPAPGPLDPASPCAQVISRGAPLLLAPETPPPELLHGEDARPLYWLGVPLLAGERTIGVLAVQSHSGQVRYGDAERDLLVYVSHQVAAAIERRRMLERLERLALYDPLTSLPNRSLLEDRAKSALARARREQSAFALLYLDLDDFKGVNDTLGHAAGDRLLQDVADRLGHLPRESDTVSRYGGDEFVILLEGLNDPAFVEEFMRRVRAAFDETFRIEGHDLFVCPSVGLALYPQHGGDLEQLLRHADQDMYRQKNAGLRLRLRLEGGGGEEETRA